MPDQKRLVLRCDGNPAQAVIELDGEPLSFVSRLELVLDASGAAEVRLTVPGEIVDVDADVKAFVTAHAAGGDDESASAHGLPPHPGDTVTVNIEGSVLNDATLRDAVEAEMLKLRRRGPNGRP